MKKYNINLTYGDKLPGRYEGGVYVSFSPRDCDRLKNGTSAENTAWLCHAEYSMGLHMMQIVRRKDRGAAGICMLNNNRLLIDPFAQDVFKYADVYHFPVMIAIGDGEQGGFCDKPGLPLLEHCLQDYPSAMFIVCGEGFWKEINNCGNSGISILAQLFSQYPNLYASLQGFNPQKHGNAAAQLMNSYADKIFFAENGDEYSVEMWLDNAYAQGTISDTAYRRICIENIKEQIIDKKL